MDGDPSFPLRLTITSYHVILLSSSAYCFFSLIPHSRVSSSYSSFLFCLVFLSDNVLSLVLFTLSFFPLRPLTPFPVSSFFLVTFFPFLFFSSIFFFVCLKKEP